MVFVKPHTLLTDRNFHIGSVNVVSAMSLSLVQPGSFQFLALAFIQSSHKRFCRLVLPHSPAIVPAGQMYRGASGSLKVPCLAVSIIFFRPADNYWFYDTFIKTVTAVLSFFQPGFQHVSGNGFRTAAKIHTQLYTGQRIQSVRLLFQRFICLQHCRLQITVCLFQRKSFLSCIHCLFNSSNRLFLIQCRSQHFRNNHIRGSVIFYGSILGLGHIGILQTLQLVDCTGQAGLIIRTVHTDFISFVSKNLHRPNPGILLLLGLFQTFIVFICELYRIPADNFLFIVFFLNGKRISFGSFLNVLFHFCHSLSAAFHAINFRSGVKSILIVHSPSHITCCQNAYRCRRCSHSNFLAGTPLPFCFLYTFFLFFQSFIRFFQAFQFFFLIVFFP